MSEKILLQVLILGLAVLITSCVVVGGLSHEEDLELERQLKVKFINTPAIKTIKTEYGDVYDCVDFYKQPAFDHPLLKNHDFHFDMKPNKVNRRVETEEESKRSRNRKGIKSAELKGVGCPRGTVPIRRTTKEDLIREKNFTEMYDSVLHPQTESEPGLHFAGGRVRPEWMRMPLGGGDAWFSLYQTPFVNKLQWSSGLIKVSNGSDYIKAGWTVNPTLYGDDRCRLFAFLHTREQRCFNVKCPGFVLINQDIPLGYAFPDVSQTGVLTIENRFYIFRDQVNGNWWLNLGKDDTDIGFWPSHIFTDLKSTADDIFWGGELFSLPAFQSSPMGSGLKIEGDSPELHAYARQLSVVDDAKQQVFPITVDDEIVSDIGWDYVRHYQFNPDKHWGRTIMFGGPGAVFGE
ncbi:PREDICTED: uncharacterized protein LOC104825020 [Tarenaya hassleriana]|uniref:uncharacterized protein LOC104825020 n=1 Tax=Tarenaya hassleriana TaxID=28532 RepID=UPI00053C350A|nr:PREDICTED: uncharacterized protein LOC104825020 [Tarenaya hassleriana]